MRNVYKTFLRVSNYKGLHEATRFIGHDNIKIIVKISIKRK
jgi:hypothetical protein